MAGKPNKEEIFDLIQSHPEGLDDVRFADVMAQLEHEERAISDARAAVIKVHDRLQSELMRRYREDPSLITNEV